MKTWQRRLGMTFGGIAALFLLVLGGVYGMSASAVGSGHTADPHPFNSAVGNAAEGERLGTVFGCTECHGPDLGGLVLMDGMPFARVPAPNLTAGAPDGALSDVEFEQAVRHGIGRDGRKLFIMPSAEYTYLSDQDVADVLAWIRTLPPVERELPSRSFGPVGRAMVALGRVQFQPDLIAADPRAQHLDRPQASDPLALGYYLTRLCTGCHGLDLGGAPAFEPGAPPAPDLTPSGNLAQWSRDDFQEVFASGRTPDGRVLSDAMPWKVIGQAEPDELDAIWAYLQTLPPRVAPAQ
ncbi:MAG TPA: c-type cytochrome [Longimicrobiales bacterium]|nr:c-type cytochrome [Longimicrobiales bacterium]